MPVLWSWRSHTSWVHVAAALTDMALRGRSRHLALTPVLGGLWLWPLHWVAFGFDPSLGGLWLAELLSVPPSPQHPLPLRLGPSTFLSAGTVLVF